MGSNPVWRITCPAVPRFDPCAPIPLSSIIGRVLSGALVAPLAQVASTSIAGPTEAVGRRDRSEVGGDCHWHRARLRRGGSVQQLTVASVVLDSCMLHDRGDFLTDP